MPKNPTLLSRSINAAKWNYLGNGARVLLQFAIGVLLARLLGPEAFGLVAIAWLMIGIGKLFADFGFSAALIQRSDLTERDIGFIFTIQVALGAALSVACFLLAGQIGIFFNRPDVSPIIEVMSWLFLIQAVGQTTTAVLNRELRFKFSQAVNVLTYLIGYVLVGIPAACMGYGVWSLVAAQMAQAVTYTVVVLLQAGVSIRPAMHPSRSGLFKFGGKVIGANFCSWGISNLDSLLIGRYLGVADLGLYNRSMTLVSTPMNAVTTSLQSVLFSAVSKMQLDSKQVALAFLAATELLAYVCFPMFFVIAAIPDVVVLGVYGEKWSSATPLMVPLALAMPVNALLALIGPILMAIDKTEVELRAQAISLAVMIPAIFVAAQISMAVVAWSILGVYFLRWALLLLGANAVLPIGVMPLINALKNPLLLALIVATTVWCFDKLMPTTTSAIRLGIMIATSGLTLLIASRLFGPALLTGPMGAVMKSRKMIKGRLAKWLRYREAV